MAIDEVQLKIGAVALNGNLEIPENATKIVVFAHGSGSGRHSPRNQFVAKELQKEGLATLLVDLLTEAEEGVDLQTAHLRFDISLLAERLRGITTWLATHPRTRLLKVGYFGASTGAAAALVAAAQEKNVFAVVSRGGRPDLAANSLSKVSAPVLLLVGGEDFPVIEMNEEALRKLSCEKQLMIIPGATHLFEEPGTLEQVAHLAAKWFTKS